MTQELREIARTLADYSDSFNSMAMYEISVRLEEIADALEAEGS